MKLIQIKFKTLLFLILITGLFTSTFAQKKLSEDELINKLINTESYRKEISALLKLDKISKNRNIKYRAEGKTYPKAAIQNILNDKTLSYQELQAKLTKLGYGLTKEQEELALLMPKLRNETHKVIPELDKLGEVERKKIFKAARRKLIYELDYLNVK